MQASSVSHISQPHCLVVWLQVLSGNQWRVTTSSESNTARERIMFNALPGRNTLQMRWVITAFTGSGAFTLDVCFDFFSFVRICTEHFERRRIVVKVYMPPGHSPF